MGLAERVQAATPAGRYRYADFLRVASILVVVFGHWLLIAPAVAGGRLAFGTVLTAVPPTQALTWVLQVMPVFFLVGGYANAASLRSAARQGQPATEWLRARALRLYWPLLPLLAVWTALATALHVGGVPGPDVVTLTQVVLVPAWFLAAYLGVVAFAPLTHRLHERFGAKALAAMGILAAAVDVASRHGGVPGIGWSTYVLVWAAVHQAGYLWHDGRLPDGAAGRLGLAAAGYGALALLVLAGGYPFSMVGANGAGVTETQTNTTPPSLAMAALAAGQLGLVLAVERPVARWLQRPRPWAAVVLAGSSIMTVYLWHMTALVALAAATLPTGIWPQHEVGSGAYWLLRLPWLAALAPLLGLLVLALRGFERPPRPRASPLGGWPGAVLAGAGVALTGAGLAVLVLGGLHDARMPLGVPFVPLGLLAAGLGALGVLTPKRKPAPVAEPGAAVVGQQAP